MLSELRKRVNETGSRDLTTRVKVWSGLGIVFVLKIAMELRETSALNLDESFYEGMISAVESGEIRALKLLIATGLDVHRLFPEGSLVAIAIAYGRPEVVELLIKEYGVTLTAYPIHAAIWERKPWQYLLKLGADLNKKRQGQTPFMYAVENGPSYLIEELASTTGIDINEGDNEFESPLERTAWAKDYLNFGELLLYHGVDVQVGLPLLGAIAKGRLKLVQRLLNQGVDVNVSSEYGDTPLRLSFEQDYFDPELSNLIVRMLIAAGTDINETYNETYDGTPLLCFQVLEAEARRFSDDHYEEKWWLIIQCLLRNGVDVNKVTLNGDSALNLTCGLSNEYHRIMLIETLLQEDADPNISNREGQTALMHDQLGSAEVHELVAWGADLGAVDALGRSALHMAVGAYNFSMVEALLECHIDTSIRDKEDDTARSYLDKTKGSANMNSRAQILQLLDKWELKNKWESENNWELEEVI